MDLSCKTPNDLSGTRTGDRPAVSVVMPVYNTPEEFLRPAIESVLAQTLRDFELLIVDDGSGEPTKVVLRQYAAGDPRVRVLLGAHQGAGQARNLGLQEARGEAVSFLDSDDLFEPELLRLSYEKLTEQKADITIFQYLDLEEPQSSPCGADFSGPPAQGFDPRDCAPALYQSTFWAAWNKLYRRSFLLEEHLTFPSITCTQDTPFVLISLTHAKRIAVLEKVLVHYRRGNPNSLTRITPRLGLEHCQAFDLVCDDLIRFDRWKLYAETFSNAFLSAVLCYYRRMDPKEREEFLPELRGHYIPKFQLIQNKKLLGRRQKSFLYELLGKTILFGKEYLPNNVRQWRFFGIPVWRYTREERLPS
ncbi:MAG: glycosyltransferase family 2 protein [Thermoguttaceae bacterium]|nr:glycosyltransferase family 2 protein [Thermoguttaceae bacterium]